jgi:predicted ATPase
VFRRIVSAVRKIVPFFQDFVLEPKRLDPTRILLKWKGRDSDYEFGPHQLSDGSLRGIALATLLLQPESDLPDVVIIDEPELGLHPHAIEIVAGLVRSVAHRTQVILATQSTALVDHFAPEEIVVTEIDHGCSQFRRLDSKQLEHWLEDYSLSQLWEKNVLGGGPVA